MRKINNLAKLLTHLDLKKESQDVLLLLKMAAVEIPSTEVKLKDLLNKSFDSNVKLKSTSIPSKILSIPEKITAFVRAKGREDVSFSSNGATRSLSEAIVGSESRIAGSLHGIGFAHDLKIFSEKTGNQYPGIDKNAEIAEKDQELVKLMADFAEQENLSWGGYFQKGGSHKIEGLSSAVYDLELHHFELKEEDYLNNLDPNIKIFMQAIDMPEDNIFKSEGRKDLYEEIIKELQSDGTRTMDAEEAEKIKDESEKNKEKQDSSKSFYSKSKGIIESLKNNADFLVALQKLLGG